MSSLVSDIIRDAYRESNINAIGVSPTAAQFDEALRLLNRFVACVYGDEAGYPLQSMNVGNAHTDRPGFYNLDTSTFWADGTLPPNARLMLNLTAPMTVYLPNLPQDGFRIGVVDKSNNTATYPLTIMGNGRTIEGAYSTVVSTNGYNAEWFYRDDLGDWSKVLPLAQTDSFPFPSDFDDYFVIGLAMRLNPRNGAAIDPQSQMQFKEVGNNFKAKYFPSVQSPSELALIRTTANRRWRYDGYGNTLGFNTGYPFGFGYGW